MKLSYRNKTFILKTNNRKFAKSLPGGNYDLADNLWYYSSTVEFMQKLTAQKESVATSREAQEELRRLKYAQRAQIDVNRALNELADKGLEIKKRTLQVIQAPLDAKLFQHQQIAFELACELPNVGLFMEQGTGKTLPTIGAIGYFIKNGINRSIVFCSKSVSTAWRKQLSNFADFPYRFTVISDDNKKADRVTTLDHLRENPVNIATADILVVNYESSWRLETEILEWKPQFVIVDESHHIKHATSNQSRAITKMGKKAKKRMILTGTPITQSPANMFSQMKFLDSTIFGNSFKQFRDRYAVMGGFKGKQIIGWRVFKRIRGELNPFYDELISKEYAAKCHSICYRVTKKELKEKGILILPEEFSVKRYTKLEPRAIKMIRELQKDLFTRLSDTTGIKAPIVLTAQLRASQIAGGFVPVENLETGEVELTQVSKAKLNLMKEVAEDLIEQEQKFIVFCLFSPEVEAVSTILSNLKIKHEVLEGKTKDRDRVIDSFEDDDSIRAIVVQIKTGREGITLAEADASVFYSYDSSVEIHEQAIARNHRIGREDEVTRIYLVAEGSWDEKFLFMIDNNLELANLVTEDLRLIFEKDKEEELMAKLPKQVEEHINNIPGPDDNGYSEELDRLLEGIQKDLEENKPPMKMFTAPESKAKKKRKKKAGLKRIVKVNFDEKTPSKPAKTVSKDKPGKPTPVNKKSPESLIGSSELITLKQIAMDRGIDPKVLRRWCRKNLEERSTGRWEWTADDPELEKVQQAEV